MSSANPDRPCRHKSFDATVGVARLMDGCDAMDPDPMPSSYQAEIVVKCADCGEPFRFVGVQAGMMPHKPMCSPDETELRAPLRPASSDPDFGLGLPGFAIGYRDMDATA